MALFYTTIQGKPLLGFQGFEYRYEYKNHKKSVYSWRCRSTRRTKCQARVFQNKDEIVVKGIHNHVGDHVS